VSFQEKDKMAVILRRVFQLMMRIIHKSKSNQQNICKKMNENTRLNFAKTSHKPADVLTKTSANSHMAISNSTK